MLYRQYSAPFFGGDYRVLRGGSWAVGGATIRPSFRNWDLPDPPADLHRRPAGVGRRRACVGTWPGSARRASVPSLVLDPPYGLLRQSYAPRRQKRGLLNADGWGVGLLDRGRAVAPLAVGPAAVERRVVRLGRAAAVVAAAVLAAVRSATVGMPMDETRRRAVHRRPLAALAQRPVSTRGAAADPAAESVCDSAMLAAHVFASGPTEVVDTSREVAARRSRRASSTCC